MCDDNTATDIDIDISHVDQILNKWDNDKKSLISILLDVQDKYKYLPKDALVLISERLRVPLVNVYSTASFYKVFSFHPKGEHHVVVCLGTACHVRGGPTLIQAIESYLKIKAGATTKDRKFTFETVRCLGACALGPIMVIDGKYHGKMTPDRVEGILQEYKDT